MQQGYTSSGVKVLRPHGIADVNGRSAYLIEKLNTSLWPVPATICLACALLAITVPAVAPLMSPGWLPASWQDLDPATARQVLGIIGGSIIGVGGVAFSVTMVALTLMSGQYGPKLLRNFLEDNGSKVTLGLFLGTYIFALVAMPSMDGLEQPGFGLLAALILAVAALLGFVKFIHDTASDVQADQVIQRTARQLRDTLYELTTAPQGTKRSTAVIAWRRAARSHRARPVAASGEGYVQTIDHVGLLEWCRRNDCRLQLRVRAGDFVVPGRCTFKLHSPAPDDLADPVGELNRLIVLGPVRTPIQDAEHAISQLNQLVARALSPGINDPGTAITCIDWFGAALSEIIDRELPGCIAHGADDRPRILVRTLDFAGIAKAIYAPLRQFGRSDVAVAVRLMESLCQLAELTRRPDRLAILALHGRLIIDDAVHDSLPDYDGRDLIQRHSRLRRLCGIAIKPGEPHRE